MAEIPEIKKLSNLSIDGQQTMFEDEFSRSFGMTDKENYNLSTIALHEACENGDVIKVSDILTEGRADLNALISGHRALRTALHKASAYGHTEVVKLLLKVSFFRAISCVAVSQD